MKFYLKMSDKDIRWEQRFSNYNKALKKLTVAVGYIDAEFENAEDALEEIIKEGLIQRFEYTFEIAWNVMKDYALYQGNSDIGGSRDAIRYAFSTKLIADGDTWMEMIKSRVKTSHTYNEETAQEIFKKILDEYHAAFLQFQTVMEGKRSGEQKELFETE